MNGFSVTVIPKLLANWNVAAVATVPKTVSINHSHWVLACITFPFSSRLHNQIQSHADASIQSNLFAHDSPTNHKTFHHNQSTTKSQPTWATQLPNLLHK
ncbi:hypothetical protein IKO50_01940 [bacterium]|nr:hypothetical protein [bacterium]